MNRACEEWANGITMRKKKKFKLKVKWKTKIVVLDSFCLSACIRVLSWKELYLMNNTKFRNKLSRATTDYAKWMILHINLIVRNIACWHSFDFDIAFLEYIQKLREKEKNIRKYKYPKRIVNESFFFFLAHSL